MHYTRLVKSFVLSLMVSSCAFGDTKVTRIYDGLSSGCHSDNLGKVAVNIATAEANDAADESDPRLDLKLGLRLFECRRSTTSNPEFQFVEVGFNHAIVREDVGDHGQIVHVLTEFSDVQVTLTDTDFSNPQTENLIISDKSEATVAFKLAPNPVALNVFVRSKIHFEVRETGETGNGSVYFGTNRIFFN